jgi:hypothetical protein
MWIDFGPVHRLCTKTFIVKQAVTEYFDGAEIVGYDWPTNVTHTVWFLGYLHTLFHLHTLRSTEQGGRIASAPLPIFFTFLSFSLYFVFQPSRTFRTGFHPSADRSRHVMCYAILCVYCKKLHNNRITFSFN